MIKSFFNDGVKADYITKSQKNVDILNYHLKINLNVEQKIIDGEVSITAHKLFPEQKFLELNFYGNMKVKRIESDSSELKFHHIKNLLTIDISEIPKDTIQLTVVYSGAPKRAGFDGFTFGEINNIPLVYNLSEPTYSPSWFPCDDDPEDKAMIEVEITNDTSFVSVSNGKLINITTDSSKRTYRWKSNYPISTYLIAVYSSKYVSFTDSYTTISGKTMPLEYYVLPNHLEAAKKDFAEHKDMLEAFEKLFGEYAFTEDKYGVAEFLWNYGAMENQTITGIGYNFISGSNFARDILAHELAHHWWGNAVGPKSWKDIWLNEGFASYSEALYLEFKYGKESLQAAMNSKFSENFRGSLYNPPNLFSETVYDKGAWVLHMLRNEIGDSNFFSSLRKYYKEFKYSNASTAEFKEVCEKVSGKNLDKFFDDWIYSDKGMIQCDYKFDTGRNTISIKQINEKFSEFLFNLDILFKFSDGSKELKTFRIEKQYSEFELNSTNKIKEVIPDPDSKLLAIFYTEEQQ
ncbi:M1 family metallopeptidase [Ignavibacterium sp.]|uniref:M1 family metallopeptidase n=1 Tax=Ignavibacterium sp. TaxID=2651167 RepID=UPI00307D96DB